jgi:hypothetical protein
MSSRVHCDKAEPPNPQLSYTAIETQVRFLQGKVLTVIDAAMPPSTQNKATKDLIKKAFSNQLSWMAELCGHTGPRWASSGDRVETSIELGPEE